MLSDLRYGFRMLLKSPGFTAVAVLALALGIGTNTSVFSLVNALLLRQLPVEQADQLVGMIRGTGEGPPCSYPDYLDYRDRNQVFSGLAASAPIPLSFGKGTKSKVIMGEIVSGNYFSVLGVRAILGRMFLPEEDQTPGTHPLAVVSYNFWKRRFGSDPNLPGKTLTLNGHSFTVVGIAPEDFTGTLVLFSPEIWVPLMMQAQVMPSSPDLLNNRQADWLGIIGRLRPDVSLKKAQAALNILDRQLQQAYPKTNQGNSMTLTLDRLQGVPLPHLRRMIGAVSGLLMAVVGLVLLIACANVANLQLARASVRSRKIAIRLALGASRGRLIQQMLTESVLLSLLGAAVGVLFASWTAKLVLAFKPPIPNPWTLTPDLSLDMRVLGFTLLMSLLTGVVFGLAPALQASKPELAPALKAEATTSGRPSRRLGVRNLLVIAQVALSLVVLITAGLFVRSLQNAQAIDPGFKTENGLVMSLDLSLQGYSEAQGKQFYRQLGERVEALPGVRSVSLASYVPLGPDDPTSLIAIEGREFPPDSDQIRVGTVIVDPQFFQRIGIPILRGRNFSNQDGEAATKVVIINETMASRFWPGEDPIGKRLRFVDPGELDPFRMVVGIVRTANYRNLGEDPRPVLYLPFSQQYSASMHLVIRSTTDPKRMIAPVRGEVQALDSNLPTQDVKTLTEHVELSLWPARSGATVLGIFGLLALLLAAMGIYGVMAYSVVRRTHEVGVRMALGAQGRDVLKLVMGRGVMLTLTGVVIGLAAASILTRWLSSFLYGVNATDPATFLVVSLLLSAVALLACYLPARRATKVDPMVALRYE